MDSAEVERALEAAIESGDVKQLTALIKEDKSRLDAEMVFGTCLHQAASAGNVAMVQRLLDLGADINKCSGIAEATPLQNAASDGHLPVVELLIARGASLDVSAPEKNPLFAAIDRGHTEIARVLLAAGIDRTVKYRGTSGKTKDALSYARDWGRTDIVQLIMQANEAAGAGKEEPFPPKKRVTVPRFTQAVLLETATREGIEAFRAAIAKYPNEQFYAIVFYADDDITSVYPDAHTVENLARMDTSADPNYYKWNPAEWQLEFGQYYDSDLMVETCELLRTKDEGEYVPKSFGKLKEQTLATLAQALHNIRDSGIFQGHADEKRLAFWPHIGDVAGEEDWMFAPVIKHLPKDIVEELRALFEFKVKR
jgi:hypothetical protein